MCSGLGNLILASAEEAESRFPVVNLAREMTTDTGGAGRWRGHLDALLAQPLPAQAPPSNGAEVIASHLLKMF